MIRIILTISCSVVLVLFLGGTPVSCGQNDQAVMKAAESWLTLMDTGKYKEAWQEASPILRNSISLDEWVSRVQKAEQDVGRPETRVLTKSEKTNKLPDNPPGEYIVLEYSTQYKNGHRGSEMLTLVHEKDGSWKVAGYYMK